MTSPKIRTFCLTIAVAVIFAAPSYYAMRSRHLAVQHSDGAFCWILPGADGPQTLGHVREMHLSLSPPNALGFWGDVIKLTRRGIYTRPHFAIAIPQPANREASRLLAWSYSEIDYYDLSERASVLGIVWFPEDCASLLAIPLLASGPQIVSPVNNALRPVRSE